MSSLSSPPSLRSSFLSWCRSFLPAASQVNRFERMRACTGALFGLVLTGVISLLIFSKTTNAIWLIAPMGASAVLLFAVPASPLAQPWSLMGGNLVSALTGVLCARLFSEPVLAAALAVSIAIGLMFALRCIHPPSGAVALTAVLGGPAIHALGFQFIFTPVAVNSLLLLLTALFFNNVSGRRYPHPQQLAHKGIHDTKDAPPTTRLGITPEDLEQVLKQYNQVLDISRDDLENILLQTEMRAYRRRFGDIMCADIMSTDVVFTEFHTELDIAWQMMRSHNLHAMPVVDKSKRILGMLTTDSFLSHANAGRHDNLNEKLQHLLTRNRLSHSDKPEVAGQIMSTNIRTVGLTQAITDLVPLMSDLGLHYLPVVDDTGVLKGMLTQSDMVAALFESSLGKLAA